MKRLIKLYLFNEFNKINIILVFLATLMCGMIFYLSIDKPMSNFEYLANYKMYLEEYKNNVSFYMFVINIALIGFLIANDCFTAEKYDILFIVNEGKNKIYAAKLGSHLLFLSLILIVEFLFYEIYPLLIYKDYKLSLADLLLMLAYLLNAIYLLCLGQIFINLFKSFLSAFLFFISAFGLKILSDVSEKMCKIISLFYPAICEKKNHFFYYGYIYVLIETIILFVLGLVIYKKRKFNNS